MLTIRMFLEKLEVPPMSPIPARPCEEPGSTPCPLYQAITGTSRPAEDDQLHFQAITNTGHEKELLHFQAITDYGAGPAKELYYHEAELDMSSELKSVLDYSTFSEYSFNEYGSCHHNYTSSS